MTFNLLLNPALLIPPYSFNALIANPTLNPNHTHTKPGRITYRLTHNYHHSAGSHHHQGKGAAGHLQHVALEAPLSCKRNPHWPACICCQTALNNKALHTMWQVPLTLSQNKLKFTSLTIYLICIWGWFCTYITIGNPYCFIWICTLPLSSNVWCLI